MTTFAKTIRGQIRQSRRLPAQGPRRAADVFRIYCRALDAFAHIDPNRKRIRVFKLVKSSAQGWRRLQGQNQLPKVVGGVTFRDGIEVASEKESAA